MAFTEEQIENIKIMFRDGFMLKGFFKIPLDLSFDYLDEYLKTLGQEKDVTKVLDGFTNLYFDMVNKISLNVTGQLVSIEDIKLKNELSGVKSDEPIDGSQTRESAYAHFEKCMQLFFDEVVRPVIPEYKGKTPLFGANPEKNWNGYYDLFNTFEEDCQYIKDMKSLEEQKRLDDSYTVSEITTQIQGIGAMDKENKEASYNACSKLTDAYLMAKKHYESKWFLSRWFSFGERSAIKLAEQKLNQVKETLGEKDMPLENFVVKTATRIPEKQERYDFTMNKLTDLDKDFIKIKKDYRVNEANRLGKDANEAIKNLEEELKGKTKMGQVLDTQQKLFELRKDLDNLQKNESKPEVSNKIEVKDKTEPVMGAKEQ